MSRNSSPPQTPIVDTLQTMQVKHLILDRDGVLLAEAEDGSPLIRADGLRWLPGALEALAEFASTGLRVSVATNQSAIGSGLMTRPVLEEIHARLRAEAKAAGGRIDEIFVCPHAPEAGCDCRKPAPGLIEAAIRSSGLPADSALVVGDALRDIKAAHGAGVKAALVRTGKGRHTETELGRRPGVEVYDDLQALARRLAGKPAVAYEASRALIEQVFSDHQRVISDAATQLREPVQKVAHAIGDVLAHGNKLLACGNGGSASDAEHLVAELVGRYLAERRALPAVTLTAGSATMTALANDYGYERVFARQVEALAQRGDVLVAISTSGNSPNVIAAARAARALGCLVVGFTGAKGGALREHVDMIVAAPSDVTARIQEIHALCIHIIAQFIDLQLANPAGPQS